MRTMGVGRYRRAIGQPGSVEALPVAVSRFVKERTTLAGQRSRWRGRSDCGPPEADLPRQRLT